MSLDPTNNHLPLSRDKSRKKTGSDCDCDPGRGSTAEAAGLNRTGWSSHINGDEGLNMRYRRRVTPRPEPISRLVSLAAGERQEATASRAAARAPGGLCPGGNDTTWNPSPLAVKKNKKLRLNLTTIKHWFLFIRFTFNVCLCWILLSFFRTGFILSLIQTSPSFFY